MAIAVQKAVFNLVTTVLLMVGYVFYIFGIHGDLYFLLFAGGRNSILGQFHLKAGWCNGRCENHVVHFIRHFQSHKK